MKGFEDYRRKVEGELDRICTVIHADGSVHSVSMFHRDFGVGYRCTIYRPGQYSWAHEVKYEDCGLSVALRFLDMLDGRELPREL